TAIEWVTPAATSTTLPCPVRPLTGTGELRSVVVPSPSSPETLPPQARIWPPGPGASVWRYPAARRARGPVSGGTTDELPVRPCPLPPHAASVSARTAAAALRLIVPASCQTATGPNLCRRPATRAG